MSSQMQAFGSWRIILLNSDDLGDAGDVLTRVGENAAAFLPGGGGGGGEWGEITGTIADQTDLQSALDAKSPVFDQDLNTDDAVVFGSVVSAGPLSLTEEGAVATSGDIRVGPYFELAARPASGVETDLITWGVAGLVIGSNAWTAKVQSVFGYLEFHEGGASLFAADLPIEIASSTDINLDPGGALNINGTPGVTESIVITGIGTLDLTKGIATGWTPV